MIASTNSAGSHLPSLKQNFTIPPMEIQKCLKAKCYHIINLKETVDEQESYTIGSH